MTLAWRLTFTSLVALEAEPLSSALESPPAASFKWLQTLLQTAKLCSAMLCLRSVCQGCSAASSFCNTCTALAQPAVGPMSVPAPGWSNSPTSGVSSTMETSDSEWTPSSLWTVPSVWFTLLQEGFRDAWIPPDGGAGGSSGSILFKKAWGNMFEN